MQYTNNVYPATLGANQAVKKQQNQLIFCLWKMKTRVCSYFRVSGKNPVQFKKSEVNYEKFNSIVYPRGQE